MTSRSSPPLRPRVKEAHRPVRLADGRIQIGTTVYGIGAELAGGHTGLAWRLLDLMDGTRTRAQVVADADAGFPGVGGDAIGGVIDQLVAGGFIEDAGAPRPAGLTEADLERYSRSARFFSWIDDQPRPSPYDAQLRLKHARVTVLGLGGTGSAVTQSLVASGVGRVHCLDFDTVELSNLNRQLLYTEDDVGHPKVDRAVANLRRLNSAVEVTGAELRASSAEDIVPLMAGCDLFALCADRPHGLIDRWANQAALRTRTPWLTGPYAGPMTSTTLFIPFQTPCWECLHHHLEVHEAGRWDGEPLPRHRDQDRLPGHAVIAPTAAIAGHLIALEALYFLAELRPQTVGRTFRRNLLAYDHNYFDEPPWWPDCPACGATARSALPAAGAQQPPGSRPAATHPTRR